VTPGFLPMLGVTPAAGRLLTDADAESATPAVLLDYGVWQQHFGGDPTVVGREILLNGSAASVAGVLPRGFTLTIGRGTPQAYDVYLPMRLGPSRNFWAFPTIVRLADGVSFAQASAGLDAFATSLTAAHPDVYADGHLRFALSPLADDMLAPTRPALAAAMAGVLLLLLVAVANATALIVARLRTRERDFAIRSAIGAGRWDLAADVLMESVVLSAFGALLGAGLAAAAVGVARVWIPHTVPRWDHIAFGWDLPLYAAGLALVGLVVAGLIPVWRASPGRPWETLRGATVQGGRAEGTAARLLLVGAQIALTVVLAFGAVQLVRSATRLDAVNIGFDPRVLTVRVPFDRRSFMKPADQAAMYERVRDRLRQVPGVESVGAISHLPLSGATLTDGYTADLSKPATFDQSIANYHSVSPGYFATLRIPILRGRDFTDVEDTTGQPVIVVDDTLAQAAFPNGDPIGQTLKLGWGIPDSRIVGVVGHTRAIEVGRDVRPQIYAPYGTFQWTPLIFTIRAAGDPMQFAGAVQAAVRDIGTGRAPAGFASLESNVDAAMSTLHSVTGLVTVLALSAGLLSAIGLYTVMAFIVHQRRRATAIRSALGASRTQLIEHHLRTSGAVLVVALPVGAALAAGLAPLFSALDYGVGTRDLASLGVATALAAGVSILGTYLPIRRAADTSPIIVLRGE